MASVLISSFVKGVSDWLSLIRRTPTTSSATATVAEDLEGLKRTLKRIEAVLQDAEEREIVDESVKLWLTEIKDVAYDAQDLLDEYEYEVLRAQVEALEEAAAQASRKRKRVDGEEEVMMTLATTSASNVAASKISILSNMADRIKKIRQRFDEISDDRDRLHLKSEDGQRRRDSSSYEYPPPTSHMIDEQEICGREDDRKKLIDWLFSEAESKFEVLAVVGKGGLGKTTLAQLVYNDAKVKDYFKERIWICVSDDFNLVRLTRAMIESITGGSRGSSELSVLQSTLQEKLDGKRVLLVLDDVWNDKRSLWESLRRTFGSAQMIRIIVTTRNTSVAEVMQTTRPHLLGHLPEEQCRKLFASLAFCDRDPKQFPSLVDIGEKIVKKCDGLPLSVKSLGGLLQHETDEGRWNEVLDSELWDEETDILPALKLSYVRMPSHLKPCFQICSIFPKDCEFCKDDLVKLWKAHGYIHQHDGHKKNTMEEIGYRYFDDLLRRSFFDERKSSLDGRISHFVMHDNIHDVARYVLEERDLRKEGEHKIRHLYINYGSLELHIDDNIKEVLRTLILRPRFDTPFVNDMMLGINIRRLAHLRYLDISLYSRRGEVFSLLESIGSLICLRHLAVSNNIGGMRLPNSIGVLYNLVVLEITCRNGLVELPSTFINLVSLTTITFSGFSNDQLPALGLLPSLASLTLVRFVNVKSIGNEFCRGHNNRNHVAFPSLTSLALWQLSKLLKWDELQEGDFPQLQKLQINCCWRLPSLPSLGNLSLLTHIALRECDRLRPLPECWFPPNLKTLENYSLYSKLSLAQRFGEVKKLERVYGQFWVRFEEIFGILKDLASPKHLILSELRNAHCAWNGAEASLLREYGGIHKLVLNWASTTKIGESFQWKKNSFDPRKKLHLVVERDDSDSEKEDADDDLISDEDSFHLLEALQPHTNLEELRIIGYVGVGYPSWMCHPSFHRLNCVYLCHCEVDRLPTLGQLPSLKHLSLYRIYRLKTIGHEFCRGGINDISSHSHSHNHHHAAAFPSLIYLKFKDMYDWEQWDDDGARQGDFPKLQSLTIYDCPRLSHVPVLGNLGMNLDLSICGCPAIHIWAEAEAETEGSFPPNVKILRYGGDNRRIYLPPGTELLNLEALEGIFWARNEELFGILNNLPVNTGGELTIAALRNVRSSIAEAEANLKSRHRLESLTLNWSTDITRHHTGNEEKSLSLIVEDDGRTDQPENASFIVLEKLQPHISLKELHITGYDGFRYPSWIGHPSFNRLTTIHLEGCRNDELPTLGQLPCLFILKIDSISSLKRIGHEFCRDTMMSNGESAFPSLAYLYLRDMPDWEEWCGVLDQDFPQLKRLTIKECPRLRRDLISLPERLLKKIRYEGISSPSSGAHLRLHRRPPLLQMILRG